MTLLDFEDYFSTNNIERGNGYFRQERVQDLEETDPGSWEAGVMGRSMYTVGISFDGEDIESADCDCLVFTEETPCKHVVAMLYAIRKKTGVQPQVLLTDEQLEALVEAMPVAALRSFITEQLEDNKKLRRTFQALGREQVQIQPVEAFSKSIADDPAGIQSAAKQQLKACKDDFKIKNYTEIVSRCLAILTALPVSPENTGVNKKKIKVLVQEAFWQLYDLYDEKVIDDYNRMRIYEYAARLVQEPAYTVSDYDPHWVDFLWHNVETSNDKQVLSLLDAMVLTASNSNDAETLKRLQAMNRTYREVTGNVKAEKPAPVDKHSDYKAAKQLLTDAMAAALAKKEIGSYNSLRDNLLTLMQQRSDVLPLRKLATECFRETRQIKYFEILKATYMNAEWEKVRTQFEVLGRPALMKVV